MQTTKVTLNVQLEIESESHDEYENQLDALIEEMEERGWSAELEYEEVKEDTLLENLSYD